MNNPNSKYGIPLDSQWAAIIFVRVYAEGTSLPVAVGSTEHMPIGHVFELDHSFERKYPGRVAFWKTPAEHGEVPESALETAIRGIKGEVGLRLEPEVFQHLGTKLSYDRTHYQAYFVVDIHESQVKMIHQFDPENEEEEPRYFTNEEFGRLLENRLFLKFHYQDMLAFRVIPAPPVRTTA